MKITVRITVYKYEINVSSFSEVCFVVFTVFPANTILPAMYIYGNIYYYLALSILVSPHILSFRRPHTGNVHIWQYLLLSIYGYILFQFWFVLI